MASIVLTTYLMKLQQNLEDWFSNLSNKRTQKEISMKDYFLQLSLRIKVYQEIVPDEKILTSQQKEISLRIMSYLEMMKDILKIPYQEGTTPEAHTVKESSLIVSGVISNEIPSKVEKTPGESTGKETTPMCPEFEFSQANLEDFVKMIKDDIMFELVEESGPMRSLSLVWEVLNSNSEKKKMSVSEFTNLVNKKKNGKRSHFSTKP